MVQYPDYKLNKADDRAPMVIRYGYGACQYNLGDLAYPRVGVGSKASDLGWPKNLVKNGSAGSSSTSWDSPNGRILTAFGGLETNYIRNYDELWRIFTSMYLHGGFLHITINLLCQIQTLWMLEPVREGNDAGLNSPFITIQRDRDSLNILMVKRLRGCFVAGLGFVENCLAVFCRWRFRQPPLCGC